jgi:hypothetical protein
MTATVAVDAAAEADRLVADVRDDPAGRMRLAFDSYATPFGSMSACAKSDGSARYRPYARAVLAFMRWQDSRGVLNPPLGDRPGSPWWRAVNEDLLRDTCEARILVQRGGAASRRSVELWIDFFRDPSAKSWYLAHNASIVAAYLAHDDLAAMETPAERFFMNVVLVRVLYAQAVVVDGRLALGRLALLSRLVGHPSARTPEVLLAMRDVLPDVYPIEGLSVEEIIDLENPVGRLLDYTVIGARVEALYASAAHELGELRLLGLVRNGAPVYAWPYEMRHVWRSRPARLVDFLTRPRRASSMTT